MGNVHYSHPRSTLDPGYPGSHSYAKRKSLGRQTGRSRAAEEITANVKIWWSIWLTVLWGGFWAATAVFLVIPFLWRNIIGSIIPSAKAYTDVVSNLGRYAKLIAWSIAVWISFTPVVINHYTGTTGSDGTVPRSRSDLTTFVNILFGLFLCTIVLAGEKLIIQLIA